MALGALLLKIFLTVIFIATGGAVFSSWGRRHLPLAIMAALVSIIGSYYLLKSIAQDLRDIDESQNLGVRTGNERISQESSEWRSDAVWSPPDNIETYSLCDNLEQRTSANCVIDLMRELGAPSKAIEFSELISAYGMNDSYMYGFRELGVVDVALVVNPHVMSDGGYYVFVNGYPEIIALQDLTNWQVRGTESINLVRPKFPNNPDAEIWFPLEIVDSNSDNEIETITIKWDIRDGCNACETLGYVLSDYNFSADNGRFLNFRFYPTFSK